MTTSKQVYAPIANTAAAFQAFVTAVSVGLHAVATVTTDTGQIAPSTVALPGAGLIAGYEMYRFSDTLQSTNPVFIKIEYGFQDTSYFATFIWYTIGTATDGAGNLTQGASARTQLLFSTSSSATRYTSYFSGDGTYLNFTLCPAFLPGGNTTPTGIVFTLDRTRDATGAGTAAGLHLATGSSYYNVNSNVYAQIWDQQVYSSSMGLWSENRGGIVAPFPPKFNTNFPSMSDGTTLDVIPVIAGTPLIQPPQLALVGYYVPDVALLQIVSVTVSGAAHNYLSLNLMGFGFQNGQTTDNSKSLLMRFE